MAKIPEYTRSIIAPRQTSQLTDFSRIESAGMTERAVAKGLYEFSDLAEKHRIAQATTELNQAVIRNKKAKLDLVDQLKQQSMADPTDFAKKADEEFRKLDEQFMNGLTQPEAKQRFQLTSQEINLGFQDDNMRWQNNRQTEIHAERIEQSVSDLSPIAFRYGKEGRGIEEIKRDIDATLVASSTFLPPETTSKMKRKLYADMTETWMTGLAESNPAAARKALASRQYDEALGGDGIRKMSDYIDSAEKSRISDMLLQDRLVEKQQKELQDKTMNDYLTMAMQGKLSSNDILNDKTLTFEQRKTMLSTMNTVANKGEQTDPAVFVDLFKRINALPDDPKRITDPDELTRFVGNGLGFADLQKLRGELSGRGTPAADNRKQFMKMAESQISGSSLIAKDPVGDENFYKWQIYFEQIMEEEKKKGASEAELLNPQSPKYLGWTMGKFVRSPSQQIKDMSDRMRAAASKQEAVPDEKKRKEGESVSAYLKRIGK